MGGLKQTLKQLGLEQKVIRSFYPFNMKKFRGLLARFTYAEAGWSNTIGKYTVIEGKKFVKLGDHSAIGSFVHIWGHGGVTIGNRVLIASHNTITSLTHDYSGENVRFGKIIAKPVVIEDDVWIGANSVIMPGITIGKGAIVGAGSIVTKNVEPYAIVAGNPASFRKYVKEMPAAV